MAEYYPLLAKAVSTFEPEALDARQAIYERARKALIGQLRSVVPALADAHIDSESRALDLAIARIEAENAVRAAIRASSQSAAPRPPVLAPRPSFAPAAPVVALKPPAVPVTPPPVTPPAGAVPSAAAPVNAPPVLRPPLPRPPVMPPRAPIQPQAPQVQPAAPVINRIVVPETPAEPLPPSASDMALQAALDEEKYVPVMRAPSASRAVRKDPVPAPAPAKAEPRKRNLRGLIVTLAIFMVVAVIGSAAYWMKQSKEDLARLARPAVPAGDLIEVPPPPSGKIAERIGGPIPAPVVAPAPTADQSITPVKVPTTTLRPAPQVAPATSIPATETPPVPQPVPSYSGPTIAVAHRAAILIDSPNEPQKMKTYVGTVIWRVEQVKREGKPTATVLRAEIDVPGAKTQAVMTLQKNTDATLGASHMMDLRFVIAPGGDVPGIRAIKVPEMRREETPVGDPLNGAPVPVMENVFFIGLTKGDAETARNLDLLATRNWIDIPVLLSNDKLAKLTFEKGATGERAMNEAIAAWK